MRSRATFFAFGCRFLFPSQSGQTGSDHTLVSQTGYLSFSVQVSEVAVSRQKRAKRWLFLVFPVPALKRTELEFSFLEILAAPANM